MKPILIFFLVFGFGYALGRKPSVSLDISCPARFNYVINGVDAPDGKYPYMLSIKRAKTRKHFCGASILTKDWALTAAHCCASMKSVSVLLQAGSNVLSEGGSEHEVNFFVMHENYRPTQNWINDYCVMRVKKPFVFGPKIQQVTLPPQDWRVGDRDLVYLTGWGYTDPYDWTVPDKMQFGNFTAMSSEKCKELTKLSHESYLCAWAGDDRGFCSGDSGSPLMKNGVQVGVASFVCNPCACGLPDFYARVPNAVNWIIQTLGEDAIDLLFIKKNM